MSRKQTPENHARYSWGAERPGVVETRAKLRIKQIPIERQIFIEENHKDVERKLKGFDDELQGAKDLLKAVAKHREKIKKRSRVSETQLARLLGDHLGVTTSRAQEILKAEAKRIDAGDLPEPAPRKTAQRRSVKSTATGSVAASLVARRKRSSR